MSSNQFVQLKLKLFYLYELLEILHSVVDALQKYEDSNHPKGETLPDATKGFRVKVVSTLLRAGISLNKIDDLRKLLEEGGYHSSSSSNMHQLVPFILS